MNIIEKLYNVCSEHRAGDYSEISTQWKVEKYQKLKEKLNPELADELDELVDEIMSSNLEELEENFRQGFCMGAELMLEIKNADIKKDRLIPIFFPFFPVIFQFLAASLLLLLLVFLLARSRSKRN